MPEHTPDTEPRNEPRKDSDEDPRLQEIQDEVDEVRARLPKNPGLGIPDPDVEPVMPPEDRDDAGPPL